MTRPLDSKPVPDIRVTPDQEVRATPDQEVRATPDQEVRATPDQEVRATPDQVLEDGVLRDRAAIEPAPATPRRTRTGAAWVAISVGVVVLVALIVFIAQNTRRVDVSFLGWNGRFPLSVALLVAAAGAAVIVMVVGTARIAQLRLAARRIRRST